MLGNKFSFTELISRLCGPLWLCVVLSVDWVSCMIQSAALRLLWSWIRSFWMLLSVEETHSLSLAMKLASFGPSKTYTDFHSLLWFVHISLHSIKGVWSRIVPEKCLTLHFRVFASLKRAAAATTATFNIFKQPIFPKLFQVRMGLPKVNFWKLLEQNFFCRLYTLPVSQTTEPKRHWRRQNLFFRISRLCGVLESFVIHWLLLVNVVMLCVQTRLWASITHRPAMPVSSC